MGWKRRVCKLAYCEVYERKKIRVQTAGMANSSREEGIRSAILISSDSRVCRVGTGTEMVSHWLIGYIS